MNPDRYGHNGYYFYLKDMTTYYYDYRYTYCVLCSDEICLEFEFYGILRVTNYKNYKITSVNKHLKHIKNKGIDIYDL